MTIKLVGPAIYDVFIFSAVGRKVAMDQTAVYRGRRYYRHPVHGHIMKVVRGKRPDHEDWVLDQREWRPQTLAALNRMI